MRKVVMNTNLMRHAAPRTGMKLQHCLFRRASLALVPHEYQDVTGMLLVMLPRRLRKWIGHRRCP